MEEDIRVRNYELRCDLCQRRGREGGDYYGSQPDIQAEGTDYEELLEMGEQLGTVPVGYDKQALERVRGEAYEGRVGENCCICCCEIEQGQATLRIECGHLHHWARLGRWLEIRKECPLCRCRVELPPVGL
jgi:hypothetical protein